MLLLVDLDGVVYRGPEPVPGIPELLTDRAARGDTIIYCTNNSRSHRTEYEERLAALGAPTGGDRIVTAARATALALCEGRDADAPPLVAMVFGGPGLARELEDVGIRTVDPTPGGVDEHPDAVVVGVDFDLTHERLSSAASAVRAGARFIATNRDPVFPTPTGLVAGAGSMVAAVEVVAGRPPDLVVGKPEPRLFRTAAEIAGIDVTEALVIGDSLGSDIAAARAVGARSVLMLTGVTTQAQLDATPPEAHPTFVAADAAELAALLESLSQRT